MSPTGCHGTGSRGCLPDAFRGCRAGTTQVTTARRRLLTCVLTPVQVTIADMTQPVDPAQQPLAGLSGERTIGQLVSDVSTDLSQIMRGELELAKAEIKQDVQHAGKGAGMFAGAAILGLYGLGLLFLGLAAVLYLWLPAWASLLIIAALLFVVAGVLALIGKKALSQVEGKPKRAIEGAQQTVATLKQGPAQLKGQRAAPALTQGD